MIKFFEQNFMTYRIKRFSHVEKMERVINFPFKLFNNLS